MPETETVTLPSYLTAEEREMVDRFPQDTANHLLTVLHDDGLYRHLRCAPLDSSFYWFEIVTWPGSLAIRTGGSGYLFSRIPDMFEFFRRNGNSAGINPGYWAEKLPDAGRSVQVYSPQVFRDQFDEAVAAYEREEYPERLAAYERERAEWETGEVTSKLGAPYVARRVPQPVAPTPPATLRKLYAEYEEDDRLRFADGARDLLRELEQAGVVSDTWEWDLTDWDWPFLWACHAIVWAIREYDRVKAGGGGG